MAKSEPIAQVECEGGAVRLDTCAGKVGMMIVGGAGLVLPGVLLKLDEARALATYLVAVADGIEGKQQTDPHAG